MNPAGIIITYIDWRKWKMWFFNVPLFLFQLTFMVVGKILRKVDAPWRRVWRAAQASHVRLCLQRLFPGFDKQWLYISFGYPVAEIKSWNIDQCDGKRFEYREPMFEPLPEFITAMIEYAEKLVKDPVARKYDWLQLALGYVVNFTIWLFWWPLWGKEIVPWFNLPGGLEVCISGLVAVLRWGEKDNTKLRALESMLIPAPNEKRIRKFIKNIKRLATQFFKGYDTAVIPPCLIVLSENWEKVKQ